MIAYEHHDDVLHFLQLQAPAPGLDDWREMVEINRDGWMRQKVHKEYALPLISIIRSRRIDRSGR